MKVFLVTYTVEVERVVRIETKADDMDEDDAQSAIREGKFSLVEEVRAGSELADVNILEINEDD